MVAQPYHPFTPISLRSTPNLHSHLRPLLLWCCPRESGLLSASIDRVVGARRGHQRSYLARAPIHGEEHSLCDPLPPSAMCPPSWTNGVDGNNGPGVSGAPGSVCSEVGFSSSAGGGPSAWTTGRRVGHRWDSSRSAPPPWSPWRSRTTRSRRWRACPRGSRASTCPTLGSPL